MSFQAKMKVGDLELNVLNADYEFSKPMDSQNRVNGRAKGGIVNLIVESTNNSGLIEWVIEPTMQKDGEVVFYRRDSNSAMKVLSFQNAYCVGYREIFDAQDNSPMRIMLKLSAGNIFLFGKHGVVQSWSQTNAAPYGDTDTHVAFNPIDDDTNKDVATLNDPDAAVVAAPAAAPTPAAPATPAAPSTGYQVLDKAKDEGMDAAKDETEKLVAGGTEEIAHAADKKSEAPTISSFLP